ncbi:1592_t:CDS:2 [Funneliformis geosporum]|uniref:1592_t:CDS:1 n=1 Tax=Funneliformis geosporum TaxID=1117311 RepID=A0A9W4WVH9_9GLOM|nr:1592_t:CDS:2 [Funneliformis geosporum]
MLRNRLELDIPYYDYGFAIEVQGEQHEKFNKFFHRGDPNNFIKQQERDQLKKELCEENRIALSYASSGYTVQRKKIIFSLDAKLRACENADLYRVWVNAWQAIYIWT